MKKRRDILLKLGLGFLGLLVLFAIFGPTIRHDYDVQYKGEIYRDPSARFWLGTDGLGRDIFARLAYGVRMSLLVGVTVQLLSLFVGIVVGVAGVFAHKFVRVPLLRLTDAMFAFPDILLAILIIGLWGPGFYALLAALSITAWPSLARLVVTQVASLKDREFVVAAKAIGGSTPYIVTRHVLPQLWNVLLAVSMVELAGTILAESTLSFLGIGIQAPDPSLGSMINVARENLASRPIQLLWPCLLLSLTIFALNFVGDGLRAALDPKSQ